MRSQGHARKERNTATPHDRASDGPDAARHGHASLVRFQILPAIYIFGDPFPSIGEDQVTGGIKTGHTHKVTAPSKMEADYLDTVY